MLRDLPVLLSLKQLDYVVSIRAFVNLAEGSIRSGKTVVSLLRWLIYVAVAPRGGELVVVGRTRDSLNRNAFGLLMDPDLMGPREVHEVHHGAATEPILGRPRRGRPAHRSGRAANDTGGRMDWGQCSDGGTA
ncbi:MULTISPECIES: hypothetical protein [unclassified Streptomyces]|uniref:hypothetical protein n=1 Tax=unclassified Streptomyces TaxID=2593676 RepID=UPI002DD991A9|nr:hypothetical protein [Streptomyces sp. NBC_01750]WSB05040.1 hypothetical protein OIE54_41080 [Streptomyces sp. NBC_01794]WSD30690.1 hypothetical protein OG966_01055 [Streptomyces sp. NBC_01750]